MNNDSIIACEHCGSNACYKQTITGTEISLMSCLSCGFISNTIWTPDSELFKQQLDLYPELYKSLIHSDINNNLWVPNIVNIQDKGMVFIDGTNEDDCEWVGVKSIRMSNKEALEVKRKNPLNKNVKFKPDMNTKKGFGKHGYAQALDYIGVIL